MRKPVLICLTLAALSCSYVGPQRLDPAGLCDSVVPDSTWKPVSLGEGLLVLVPSDVELPHVKDQVGDTPLSHQWGNSELSLGWDARAVTPPLRHAADSSAPALPEPYTTAASPDCSAPAPKGWTATTYIWTDRDQPYHQHTVYIARVIIMPNASAERLIDLVVVARVPAALGTAMGIVKSLRGATKS